MNSFIPVNDHSHLPPETELLLRCARTDTGAVAERIRALVEAGLDWADLSQMAARHKLQPLLFWHIKAICPDSTPSDMLAQLEKEFHANAWLNLHLSRELIKIVKLLQADGIRIIPFKGVTLAASVYGNLSLRHAGDIDLLVSPAEIRQAKQLLLNVGFKTASMSAAAEAAYLQTANHFCLSRAGTRTTVELHWQILPKRYPPGVDFESLWQRSRPIELLGERIPGLCQEDLLSFLCVHLLKHPWPSLRWLADIAELIKLHQHTIDWPAVLSRPAIGGSRRMLWLGVYLAQRILDAPLPKEVRAKIESDPALPLLAEQVGHRLFQEECLSARANWQFYLLQLKLLDSLSDRLRYVRYLVTPYNTAPGYLTLPRWLYPLYYVTRPLRFLMKVSRNQV